MLKHYTKKFNEGFYDNHPLAKFVVEKLLKNINMESLNGKDISYSWENFYKNIYDFALKTKEYMGEYESVSELFNLYPFCDKLSKALYVNIVSG